MLGATRSNQARSLTKAREFAISAPPMECGWSPTRFGNEDFRAAQISHAGLATGLPETIIYCGLEENIVRYYDAFEKLL